ncbi:MAG TPA: plastocyanin/azurin family copper-binding protein [Candidatus Limnocylindria bacterium]|nr:plastocyanin/azurin family copper-binding protein [Candidatus Limnocylindria bacterium]
MTLAHRLRRPALVLAVVAMAALAVGPAFAADATVNIVDKSYEPATITIAQGDTVTWTVTKGMGEPHSVTSGKAGAGQQVGGAAFDSGIELKENGDTFNETFDTAGEYDYFCQVHPVEMTGKVVVLAPGQTPGAVEPPPSEVHTGVAPERKLLAGGILFVSIVLMFGMAWVWRRMNPA